MRSVNLARVAIEAEILRYKSMAVRQGRRAGFGVAALIFGLGFLITLEIACWQVARRYMDSIYATLCLMGFNFVVAAVFGFVGHCHVNLARTAWGRGSLSSGDYAAAWAHVS